MLSLCILFTIRLIKKLYFYIYHQINLDNYIKVIKVINILHINSPLLLKYYPIIYRIFNKNVRHLLLQQIIHIITTLIRQLLRHLWSLNKNLNLKHLIKNLYIKISLLLLKIKQLISNGEINKRWPKLQRCYCSGGQ